MRLLARIHQKQHQKTMQYEGVLTKMQTEFANPIQYYLVFDDGFLHMNQLLGKDIEMVKTGTQCLCCGKRKNVFAQGFCYDCFSQSAQAGAWIMRPELSQAHLGIADRDLDYETRVQLQPHVVYLACASEIKVGVTRSTQMPTRWIDQGASFALPIVEVPNRYLAGISEVALKTRFTDKINWKKMIINDVTHHDLRKARLEIRDVLPGEVREFFIPEKKDFYEFVYPVLEYPKTVTTFDFKKSSAYTGKLIGIKGQYLIFEDGTVLNVRSAEGNVVRVAV